MPLTRLRTFRVPTLSGCALIVAIGAAASVALLISIHPWLATSEPAHTPLLVIEGWLPDYALEEAVMVFRRDGYGMIVTTGVRQQNGSMLTPYPNAAAFAAASLRAMGVHPDSITIVPALESPGTNRTRAAAFAFARWRAAHRPTGEPFTLVSLGAHARRSRMIFARENSDAAVGVIAIADRDYDGGTWWSSSAGVKTIIEEVIGLAFVMIARE